MTTGEGVALDHYTRLYKDHHAALLAYARTLSAGPAQADDLVAEARFRVWRRHSAGQRIDDMPGQLRDTVRALAADPARTEAVRADAAPLGVPDAGQVGRVASVLSQLPQRWLRVLWLTEVEGRPLDAVAQDLGTGRGATAVLLHQAHEGLRQGVRRTAQPHVDTVELARIGQRDLVSRRNEERLTALTGPALLVLADTAVGSGLLSLAATAATAAPAVRPTGATQVAPRPIVSHRGPRRRRPVRVAAAGGLVAAAAGLVTALALTGAAPAARTTAAATPTVGPTGTSAVGAGPLAGASTPLRTSHAAPASTSESTHSGSTSASTHSAANVFTATAASVAGRPATTAGLAPASSSLTHGTTTVRGTPATPTAQRSTPVTSTSRAGTPTATHATTVSAAPAPTRSTTPTPTPSASAPTSTKPSGTASVPPSKTPTATATPTVSPTGTPSPTTTATFSSSSATVPGSASPTGSALPMGSALPTGSITP